MAGNQQDIKKQSDVEGVTFNGTAFMESISNTIDANRSDVITNQTKLVKTTVDLPPAERVESRLNTFYRLLGLPATRDIKKISGEDTGAGNKFLNQYGTINYFSPGELSGVLKTEQGDNIGDFISKRETDFAKKKSAIDFITMLDNPLTFEQLKKLTKVTVTLDDGTTVERKPSIFPLVVDAATPIFPLSKRMAPLFYDGDFIISGDNNTRLPRTFLESIIYMRTQRFTEDMQRNINEITKNIKVFVQNINANEQLTPEQQKAQTALLNSLGVSNEQSDYNLIEAQTINRLVQAISASAKNYREVVKRAKELSKEVDFKPAPKDTAKEKSGNTTEVVLAGSVGFSLESRIQALNSQIEKNNLILTLLPTNRVLKADTRRRIADDEQGSANITPDIFVSEFTEIMALDNLQIQKQLREAQTQKNKKLREFEKLKSNIMYYSGEAQGLSIFDVLCIFLAMFTISLDNLIGLLNNDARARLQNNKFFQNQISQENNNIASVSNLDQRFTALLQPDGTLSDSIPSVSSALQALQTKVEENFDLAAAFFNNVRAGQNRKG